MIKNATLLKHYIFAMLLITGTAARAGTVRSVQSGDWENSSTWSLGIQPANGDSIIISAGNIVKVTAVNDYSGGASMQLNIFGELTFQTGKKLTFPLNSIVTLQTAALITPGGGGGNSNYITIGTTIVWNAAMGSLSGFLVLPATPLPVELIDFRARVTSDETIQITWETASEVNNDHFEVERSPDGVNFESLGSIAGHGTSATGYNYEFVDEIPEQGENYYRLKQVDFDNKFSYSGVLFCKFKKSGKQEMHLFPNPTKGEFFISIVTDEEIVNVEVQIADTKANILLQKQFQKTPGSDGIRVNELDSMLKPGIYFVTVILNNEAQRKQLVVY